MCSHQRGFERGEKKGIVQGGFVVVQKIILLLLLAQSQNVVGIIVASSVANLSHPS